MASEEIYTKEKLIEACNLFTNYVAIAQYISGRQKITNRTASLVKAKVEFYNIDFKPVRKTPEKRRRTTAEILVHNPDQSTRTLRKTLKKAMKDSNVLHECQICSNPGEYNGEPLRLDIDHVNGDWTNNTLKNLRFLCPNCHSQTETSGNKVEKTVGDIYTDTEITKHFKDHKTYAGIARAIFFDKRKIESNITKYIASRIEELNLDISHFNNHKRETYNQTTIQTTLVNNQSIKNRVHPSQLKRLMIEEAKIEYCCDKCNNPGEHMGKELVLDIDHKDSDWKNNEQSNLRFLCKNCHSQTDSHSVGKINPHYKIFTKDAIIESSKNNFTIREIVKDIMKVEKVDEKIVNFLYTRVSAYDIDILKYK